MTRKFQDDFRAFQLALLEAVNLSAKTNRAEVTIYSYESRLGGNRYGYGITPLPHIGDGTVVCSVRAPETPQDLETVVDDAIEQAGATVFCADATGIPDYHYGPTVVV